MPICDFNCNIIGDTYFPTNQQQVLSLKICCNDIMIVNLLANNIERQYYGAQQFINLYKDKLKYKSIMLWF